MQKIAYGYLNLKPHEFWSLTLKEYKLMVEGFNEKNDSDWRKLAQLASWIIQPHVKKRIKADDLYVPKGQREKVNPEEKREELEDLAEELNVSM